MTDATHKIGCLLVSRNDLFGARMLPFINALRIGHDYDIPVKIYWPSPPEGTTNIGQHIDVFSPEFIKEHFISHSEFKQLSQKAVALAQVKQSPATDIAQMVRQGQIFALHSSQTAMTLNGEDAKIVNESYRATLDRITFTDVVAHNIQKINSITSGQKMLAYHVRHGDVTQSYRAKNKPWVNKFIPSEFFVQHFKKHDQHQGAKALLFGDFEPSLDWLCKQCPDLIRISDIINLKALGSLQRDFLELYAMSRADMIIGPRSSGFSQLAASLGGVEFRDIMKDLHPKDRASAFAQIYTRVNDDPESFSSFGETAQCLAHLIPYLFQKGDVSKACVLLSKEIKRGNQIAYLYPLWADAAFRIDDFETVKKVRAHSLSVPMLDAGAIADVEGFASLATAQMGDTAEALRLLNLAAFQTPYAPQVHAAFAFLNNQGEINDETFYPIDRALMHILQPGASVFQPVFFAWEWRHSLISNFQRPLTHAGAAARFLASITKSFEQASQSESLSASFGSFKSLILMGQGFKDDALELSMQAVDMAPNNPHVIRRHIQNLIQVRNPQAAIPFGQALCALEPNVQVYKALLASIYFDAKQRKKAMSVIENGPVGKITFPAITLRHANALLLMKKPEVAEALLEQVLPEIRWPDQYLDVQTTTKIKLGHQDDIMPMLLHLQKDAGAARNVSHLIAKIRHANNDLEGAAKDAEFAVKYGPKLAQYKALLATIFREQGREEDAVALIAQLPPLMQKRFKKH